MALVEIRDVFKSFKREAQTVDVYSGLTVDFEEGSYTALMGPSGSGKSTLLNLVAGLEKPSSGTLNWVRPRLRRLAYALLTCWGAPPPGPLLPSAQSPPPPSHRPH